MSKKTKWQKEFEKQVELYTNSILLEDILFRAGGDDWDGAFTNRGYWKYNYLVTILKGRLKDWLKE